MNQKLSYGMDRRVILKLKNFLWVVIKSQKVDHSIELFKKANNKQYE